MTTGGKRAVVVAAALTLVVGCGPSPADLSRLYAEAEAATHRAPLADALALAQRGAAEAERAGSPVLAWEFRLIEGEVRAQLVEIDAANQIMSATVPADAAFDVIRARQRLLRARVLVARGDLKAAEAEIAPVAQQPALPPDVLLDQDLLRTQILYRTGRAPAADSLLADLRGREIVNSDAYRRALVLQTSGMGLATRGRFDEALSYFEQILALPVGGTIVQGGALNNTGIMLARLGDYERAIPFQERAVEAQKNGRRQDYMQALGELGSTHYLRGDVARGMQAWQEALRIATEGQLRDDALLWARNLVAAAIQEGRWDDAERYNAEAERWTTGEITGTRRTYGLLTAAQIAAGRDRRDEARRLFGEALAAATDAPSVVWTAHQGLARLAVADRNPAEATREFELTLQILENTRSALLRADNRISFTSRLATFYRGYVSFLMSEGRVERALEVADASRARVLAERQGTAAPAVRANARQLVQLARQSGSTFVFYWLAPAHWLAPQQSWAWTVSASGITATPLPPLDEINEKVAAHQSAIQNAMIDPLAGSGTAGEWIYTRLVQPALARAPRDTQVVIVPDGSLHRINFETLPVPTPARHYWIEDVTLQIAPSLSMLTAGARASSSSARTLLLVGNPTARTPEFPALSYAAAEMSGITKHFAPAAVTSVSGADASPAAFRAAEPGRFSVIHFTSHAVANVESPLDSAVILSGPDDGYKLYAREVAALPLRADLVTVSACRSAGERAYAGEGLVGFAWAFLRAGSQRVMAGLWDVDDRSTATLMEHVYARIAAGDPPAVALRDAKLALIKAGFPRPFYWAPFQMFTVRL